MSPVACGGVRMNCRYTDEELKEDVERTIGIRAKDIEQIQFCGLWHIRFRAFGTDFYYYRADSDDTVHLVESPGNGSNRKSRPLGRLFFVFCTSTRQRGESRRIYHLPHGGGRKPYKERSQVIPDSFPLPLDPIKGNGIRFLLSLFKNAFLIMKLDMIV